MTQKIALIGANGNVCTAASKGLINFNGNFQTDDIIGVTKEYHTEPDLYPVKIKQCKTAFLAVKPKDAIETLKQLEGKLNKNGFFISAVSGLGTDIISKMLGLQHWQIVKMTLNINIEFGRGIVLYSASEQGTEEVERIFGPLTMKLIKKRSKKIIDAVSYGGSGDASVAKYVWLRYQDSKHHSFTSFLHSLTMDDPGVQEYIRVMKVTCKEIFRNENVYDPIIFESTLEALQTSCFVPDDIIIHIERVATKGGCTEVGISRFNSLEDLNEKFFIDVFSEINKKAISFKKEIRDGFNTWKTQKIAMTQEYGLPANKW